MSSLKKIDNLIDLIVYFLRELFLAFFKIKLCQGERINSLRKYLIHFFD